MGEEAHNIHNTEYNKKVKKKRSYVYDIIQIIIIIH